MERDVTLVGGASQSAGAERRRQQQPRRDKWSTAGAAAPRETLPAPVVGAGDAAGSVLGRDGHRIGGCGTVAGFGTGGAEQCGSNCGTRPSSTERGAGSLVPFPAGPLTAG